MAASPPCVRVAFGIFMSAQLKPPWPSRGTFFELRLDTFNTFNHTQYDGVNSTLNVTSLTDPTPTNLALETAIGRDLGR